LRQIADPRAGLDKAFAGVGLDETGGNLQQRRLAGAVPPDKADPSPAAMLRTAPANNGVPEKVRLASRSTSKSDGMVLENQSF
jgi:hypothetical protein